MKVIKRATTGFTMAAVCLLVSAGALLPAPAVAQADCQSSLRNVDLASRVAQAELCSSSNHYSRILQELADDLRDGTDGLERNWPLAADWFSKAADYGTSLPPTTMGHIRGRTALNSLLEMLATGGYGLQRNLPLFRQLAEAAEAQGIETDFPIPRVNELILAESSMRRAFQHHQSGEYNQALALLTTSASAGNPDAMFLLGYYHESGLAGLRSDPVEAISWYERGTFHHQAEAMNALGHYLHHGLAGPTNHNRAVELYERAAQSGVAVAVRNLGAAHETGLGDLPVDRQRAMTLYRRALSEGYQPAQEDISRLQRAGVR
jgi:uncharacterized protein